MITSINEFKINENNNNINKINIFFNSLFEFRQIAHNLHLTKSNYAEHMALGDFYEKLLLLIDQLIETYQGQFGQLENFTTNMTLDTKEHNIITIFESMTLFIKDEGKLVLTESHLLNILDEIIALSYQTLYKLKFL